MNVKIKRIDPVQLGKVLAVLYALLSLIFVPFMLIAALAGGSVEGAIGGLAMMIIFPVMYIVLGFVGGVIGAFIYNFVASKIGGIELELDAEEVTKDPALY